MHKFQFFDRLLYRGLIFKEEVVRVYRFTVKNCLFWWRFYDRKKIPSVTFTKLYLMLEAFDLGKSYDLAYQCLPFRFAFQCIELYYLFCIFS